MTVLNVSRNSVIVVWAKHSMGKGHACIYEWQKGFASVADFVSGLVSDCISN